MTATRCSDFLSINSQAKRRILKIALFIFLGLFLQWHLDAQTVNLTVVGPDNEPIDGYRWLLEQDATFQIVPGDYLQEPLALNFHRSYMPVAAQGHGTGPGTAAIAVDPNQAYFLSILPDAGYTIGGAPVRPGQTDVTVTCNKFPIPTAQISVFVFHDNFPINNAPDLPEEQGLAGFKIVVYDAAGRYGQAGGQVMMDAYGNPIGTTYNQNGNVVEMGTGVVKTDANGEALVRHLPPGKYGVQAVPPAPATPNAPRWIQTSTIEGSKTIDAWVKAGEPSYFMEFGPPGWHVFIGFVQPFVDNQALNGTSTISGQVVNLHLGRPPDSGFYEGAPVGHTVPMIGLNSLAVGLGEGIYAQSADDEGNFSIPNVPPGDYQLVVWDKYLDFVIAQALVTVPPEGGNVDLGQIGVFQWFSRLENHVFLDANENGFRDPEEAGIPEVAVNLRFRDGTIYQSFPTDTEGFVPFDEVFPFFHWLVAEVDFAWGKATGCTVTVDDGGAIDPNDPWSFGGQLNPQPQPENNDQPYRTETGPVLTQAFQGFLGQTSVIQWGKAPYAWGENGGISGIVFYAVTRAENDPRYAAAEEWEPGIPRVQVNLYHDMNWDDVIDDLDGDGGPTLADVDNHPFGNFPGPEDVDRNGNLVFDPGDALQITTTDSWDDSLPEGCPGDPNDLFYLNGKGYDGMRVWNQVRPGVFDGGYAFDSYFPGGMASGSQEVDGLPVGIYIVEAVPPKSPLGEAYEIIKEEDKNVDFGDQYVDPGDQLPPKCVGDLHLVPPELVLFPGIPAPYAGKWRPLSDRKSIILNYGQNAAVDFFMCTQVPIAGHVSGMVLNDLANEFDPNSPQFGEKYAPPWLPVAFYDFTGRVITRVYTDKWGRYNALIPSTFTANIAAPSGMSPNMLIVCINDRGPIEDPDNPGTFIQDPYYNPQYSQFCYTFQYMPGTTTYLDTPVLPIAAFAGADQFPLDCEFKDGTPKISWVSGPAGGPYVPAAGEQITLVAEGPVDVPNPEYDGPGGVNPKTITRDYGFGGTQGSVTVNGVPLAIDSWDASTITATVPAGVTTGQLMVTRGDNGLTSLVGVTLTVGPFAGAVHHVVPTSDPAAKPIQDAIDAANPGDLILVAPGNYSEAVIMWKPVLLQGWGAGSTVINAVQAPGEKLQAWRDKVALLVANNSVELLPGQNDAVPDIVASEQGAGIFVLGKDADPVDGGFGLVDGLPNSRIDGFTVTGATVGGGIVANGHNRYLEITNNRVIGNQGFFHGGIRSGHPNLISEVPQGLHYTNCDNPFLRISYNHVTQNGGLGGFGGGISLCTGSEAYEVTYNQICGNFTQGEGAGIGHIGWNNEGLIAYNGICFNQSFNQGQPVSGGGIFVGGQDPLVIGGLTAGSGKVRIDSNVIQGNQAGAGDGGGIRLSQINGQDVEQWPNGRAGGGPGQMGNNNFNRWYQVWIFNNMIVDNMAGLAGGGISIQDAAATRIYNNTIANNDSTATAGLAFTPGIPEHSNTQPAGVVGRKHSDALAAVFGNRPEVAPLKEFANPFLVNNIILHNRSFYFVADTTQTPPFYGLVPDIGGGDPAVYWDLGVLGIAGTMNPLSCVLTDTTGYDASNISADPLFVAEYFNGDRGVTIQLPEQKSSIQAPPAFDEGGNFIEVRFGPLTLWDPATGDLFGDYHIQGGSPAIGAGRIGVVLSYPDLAVDFDGEPRPSVAGTGVDIGADEVQVPAP